jgi:hypothetical protein
MPRRVTRRNGAGDISAGAASATALAEFPSVSSSGQHLPNLRATGASGLTARWASISHAALLFPFAIYCLIAGAICIVRFV